MIRECRDDDDNEIVLKVANVFDNSVTRKYPQDHNGLKSKSTMKCHWEIRVFKTRKNSTRLTSILGSHLGRLLYRKLPWSPETNLMNK